MYISSKYIWLMAVTYGSLSTMLSYFIVVAVFFSVFFVNFANVVKSDNSLYMDAQNNYVLLLDTVL